MRIRRVLGVILMVIGGIATPVCVLGLMDPVGTKMADDGDPFGAPPSTTSGVIGVGLSLAVVVVGVWLYRRATGDQLPDVRSAK